MTVSAGIAAKKLPSAKLSCIPLTIASFTAVLSSPGSSIAVMLDMTNRQFDPGAQPCSMSRIRSITTGNSSV